MGQFMLNGALTRMRNRKLSMAWEKWQFEAECMKEEKRLLGGAATRWLRQKLGQAFNTWKERLAEARHQEYMMTQSLVSWCLRDLVKGFNTWRSVAYHWRLRQLQAEHKLRVKVKDAYPVEHWLPTALPRLTSPMKQLPALPCSNI